MEVGLGPGHIVLEGDPAQLPKKGAQPPIFGPYRLWPNGWMDQDAICPSAYSAYSTGLLYSRKKTLS